eukprot:1633500-Heterocapsa_arctica.AAC.1
MSGNWSLAAVRPTCPKCLVATIHLPADVLPTHGPAVVLPTHALCPGPSGDWDTSWFLRGDSLRPPCRLPATPPTIVRTYDLPDARV